MILYITVCNRFDSHEPEFLLSVFQFFDDYRSIGQLAWLKNLWLWLKIDGPKIIKHRLEFCIW